MSYNRRFTEENKIMAGFGPVDMSAAANNGAWIDLSNFGGCAIVLFKAAGTAGDNPTLTLTQAQDNAGTGAKALNIDRVMVKKGTVATIENFTEVDFSPSQNTYVDTTGAASGAIYVAEVGGNDLDVNNGFTHVRAAVAKVGTNPQPGALLYILRNPRHMSTTPDTALS